MVVHRWSVTFEGGLFGGVVLGAPAATLHDRSDDDLGVVGSGGEDVVPDEAGLAIVVQHFGGQSVGFGGVDSGGL